MMMELENRPLTRTGTGRSGRFKCPMVKRSVSAGPSYIPRAVSQWAYNYLLMAQWLWNPGPCVMILPLDLP